MTNKRKLFSLDDYKDQKRNQEPDHDPAIAHLAHHMHRLRESIPVNHHLKQELKQKLREQLQHQSPANETPSTSGLGKRLGWILGTCGLVLILIIALIWTNTGDDRLQVTHVQSLGSFEPDHDLRSEQPVAISPDGSRVLLEKNGRIEQYTEHEGWQPLFRQEYAGQFHSPAWANERHVAALIYEEGDRSEIWIVGEHQNGIGSRLLYREKGVHFQSVTWSENDEWLAVTYGPDEQEEKLIHYTGTKERPFSGSELKWPKCEDVLGLEAVHWPREIRNRLDEGQRFWLDWNKERSGLILLIAEEQQMSAWKLETQ